MIAAGRAQQPNGSAIVAKSGKRKRAVQPLRSHPLFVPAVALWFASLFGLGSLALRTAAWEAVVAALQVDALIPAAGPPLGTTARVLIACGMALLGALAGFVVAWFAAHSLQREAEAAAEAEASTLELPSFRKRDLHPDAPVRAPVQAHDEFGERILDDPVAPEVEPETVIVDAAESESPAAEVLPASKPEPAAPPALVLTGGAQRIANASLEDLSNVELVERLAIAMHRRAVAEGFADSASDAPIAFPARAMRREDLTPALRRLAEKRPQETETALRGALAALQRMSGAA